MKYLSLALLGLLCGCANYRYDVVADGQAPHQVLKGSDLVVPAHPVELRFQQVESRCVMVIDNRTDTAVTLDGDSSAIVDPRGQTRAIATRLIPAGAYAKLILPPMAEYDPHGPQWHFGIGVGARVDASDLAPSAAGDRQAVYLVTSTEPMEYWEWSGAGEVRVVLALKQGDQTHRHEIVVRRIKK